nr:unnamed protein product [Digitaria exilis]
MVKDFGAQREIAGQIQELKARIIVASQRRDRYTLDEVVVGSGSKNVVPIYPRLPALYVEATNLVGMDGPSEDLIRLVTDEDLSIPEWLTSLVNLNYIQISINRLRQETLHVLGDLPTLLCLTLYSHKTGPKERLVICNSMFQRLKRLVLWCEVGGLMFESGAMLSLEALEFQIMANEARSMCNAPDLGICYLSSLSDICVWIDCGDAKAEEVHALEGAIRASAKLLPNCPTPYFHRLYWRQ